MLYNKVVSDEKVIWCQVIIWEDDMTLCELGKEWGEDFLILIPEFIRKAWEKEGKILSQVVQALSLIWNGNFSDKIYTRFLLERSQKLQFQLTSSELIPIVCGPVTDEGTVRVG